MKLHKIEAGSFIADGGAMFGVVPKKVWQKRYPCNEDNFCTLHMRSLVVKTADRLIVIDTGTGSKQKDKLKYYQVEDIVDFDAELVKLGYSADEVTDVILSHLHFDHCGSCTKFNEDKSDIIPTFPNAVYWVGKAQWENFLNPNVREGDSYFPENMLPVDKAGQLRLVENDQLICQGVEVKIFNGHTVGQLAVYIHQDAKTFIFVGDVIPILASLPIAWVSSYDTFPITSMEDKERMLSEAVEKKQILFFEHDAYNECCTVRKENGRYRVDKVFKLNEVPSEL